MKTFKQRTKNLCFAKRISIRMEPVWPERDAYNGLVFQKLKVTWNKKLYTVCVFTQLPYLDSKRYKLQ